MPRSGVPVDTFPRQQARTRRFSLGAPRTFTVAADGRRVLFLRSAGGEDPLTALWVHDVASGKEWCAADPRELMAGVSSSDAPAEERARRERSREQADGIVAYSADRDGHLAAFALAGQLWLVDIERATSRTLPSHGPVFDPRLEPSGRAVAYCSGPTLRVVDVETGEDRVLAAEDDANVQWGQAEFVAAEEMGRTRGHWWAPDGRALLVARVDVSPVATWWIADPAQPDRPPRSQRYPAAGTADASVSLFLVGTDGARTEIGWDHARFPYLVSVTWGAGGPPLLVVEARDHHVTQVLEVDLAGTTAVVVEDDDPAWVDHPGGVPAWLADGRLVWSTVTVDTYRLMIGGDPVTPIGLQVRDVIGVGERDVVFAASSDPTETELWRWSDGVPLEQLTSGGVAGGVAGGSTVAIGWQRLDAPTRWWVVAAGHPPTDIPSHASAPLVAPAVRMLEIGPRKLRVGVLLPRDHHDGRPLPVIMSPYGGPGMARVTAARSMWLESQWLADRGFAVVVADGRGSPGRGPAWERSIRGDFATPVLDDQVEALRGAAAAVADLDLTRVGIRGWSFGGYLAALAVLRRPDVFSVAVAGAPVTDWSLYDTFYTERYLGHPAVDPDAYERSSLLDDAAALERPLLIIHGLVDDNVFVAHSLRLSQRLVGAGRSHSVLPLSGVTHMASAPEVAEHLLELQVEFLGQHLGVS